MRSFHQGGEDAPRCIQPTLMATLSDEEGPHEDIDAPEEMVVGAPTLGAVAAHPNQLQLGFPVKRGEVENWDAITKLLESIYRHDLRVESEQHPV